MVDVWFYSFDVFLQRHWWMLERVVLIGGCVILSGRCVILSGGCVIPIGDACLYSFDVFLQIDWWMLEECGSYWWMLGWGRRGLCANFK